MENLMYNDVGMMVVREDHCCDHFEPNDDALVPMRECWCCKWSEFRSEKEGGPSDGYSVCNYIGNAKEAVNR